MSTRRRAGQWMRLAVLSGFLTSGLVLFGISPGVGAQQASFDPAGVWPDLSGTWVVANTNEGPHGPYHTCCIGKADWVPFTPTYRKIRDDFASLPEFTIAKNTNNMTNCIPPGVPGTLEHPILFEFLLDPGRVTLITMDGSVRRIWTDGRGFPQDVTPSPQGYSIGHWQHRTLVIETRQISHNSDLLIAGNIKVNNTTVVEEKFTVVNSHDLELEVTVTDPQIFTQPYTYQRSFKKVPGTFDVGCAANNRDNGVGEVDLTPPQ